ncbi:type II toxin-antitoxin system MqsA family antitoxin [Endozoicomonas numazuensis]|uniref:type II toxin-antitoxin system MqsA family antitoxin n=1 Tax=Endozoicomonas numazuensis TaxID=1137799 RepID=UPI0006899418|nr:type II toxin-antitoxin system MqsA family antitoxin [Endozoicomonas numazuensis]
MQNNMNVCPICESGQLHEKNELEETTYKGVTGQTPLYYSICDACGSEQGNAAQSRKNKQAMLAFKKQVDGFLSGEEVREQRKRWDITQAQAARIFGGGPVAFSKYEADDVVQSEPMDKLLRVAQAVPEAFIWLAQQAGEMDVCQKARKASFDLIENSLTRKDDSVVLFKARSKPVVTNLEQISVSSTDSLQIAG